MRLVSAIAIACLIVGGNARADGDAASVEISADFNGRSLTWKITNRADAPIMRIRIPAYYAYDHVVPDGWHFEDVHDAMHAWTQSPARAIRRGRTGQFSVTGGASFAKPGIAAADVTLADDRTIRIDDVVTFEREHWTTIAIPPLALAALVIVHLARRRRRLRPTPPD
jgi:hypothetical protein